MTSSITFLASGLSMLVATVLLPMSILPVKVKRLGKAPKNAVYCPNHSSYLDIPTLFWAIPGFFVILGKREISKMPVLGYVFRNLYITVDRNSAESRRRTLLKCKTALKKGRSLALFPEGRINNENVPKLSPFQDGAFILAVEQQLPIVPVTIPKNWIILPGNQTYLNQGTILVTVHKPISTIGLTIKDIPQLKEQVFGIIEAELKRYLKDDYK